MGIHTTIHGQDVEFTGLFAEVAENWGFTPVNGVITISKNHVGSLINHMVITLSEGAKLTENGVVKGYLVANLADDARTLSSLMWWVVGDEEELFFS